MQLTAYETIEQGHDLKKHKKTQRSTNETL